MCESGVHSAQIHSIRHPCLLSSPVLARRRPNRGRGEGGEGMFYWKKRRVVWCWWWVRIWWWFCGSALLVVGSGSSSVGPGYNNNNHNTEAPLLPLRHHYTAVPGTRLIATRKGSLRGLVLTLEDRQAATVEVYLGIPYASPPVGNLRFMPPVTSAPWRGVKHADHFGPVCPQQFPDIANETDALRRMPRGRYEALKRLQEPLLRNQSEDCLFLNIYVPVAAGSSLSISSRDRLPVIVYIHGESYAWGSGNLYDGSVLAALGRVVVVTLNYRLGILGFLNPNTDPYSRSIANHGLMDQIAALHWLQENVAEFGGDPASITIMGHGTGAACITLLMTSPAVPDGMLFHKAIVLSGSALSPWALIQDPTRYAMALARQLNCSTTDLQTYLLKCLREKPLSALMGVRVDTPDFLASFGPSVDGVVIDSEWDGPAASSAVPSKKFGDRVARYDLLLGVAQAESYFTFTAEDNQYGIEVERRNRILRTYVRNTYQYHLQEILATIVNEYTDWEKPVLHPITIRDETLEALSDAQYVAPMVKMADLHSSLRPSASYFYVFDYQTKTSDYPQRLGCVHGEELAYVFGAPLVPSLGHFSRNYTKAEAALAEMVINYWSNFARTGNPNDVTTAEPFMGRNPERATKAKHVEWPPYERQHRRFLSLGTKPRAKSHYRSHRLALWLSLIPDLHRPTGTEVPRLHHLLDDYDDPASYDGKVRAGPPATHSSSSSSNSIPAGTTPTDSRALWPVSVAASATSLSPPAIRRADAHDDPAFTDPRAADVTVRSSSSNNVSSFLDSLHHENNGGGSKAESFGAYSTALSVTIAIGCSLLILNVLIFAGVYYQRDKQRLEAKRRCHNGMGPMNISGELEERESQHHQPLSRYNHHQNHQPLEETGLNCTLQSGQGGGGGRNPTQSPSGDLAPLSPSSIGSAGMTPQLPPPEFADLPPLLPCHHQQQPVQPPPNGSITTLYGGGGGSTLPRGGGVKTTLTSSGTLPRRSCSVGVQSGSSTSRRPSSPAFLLELQPPKTSSLKRSPGGSSVAAGLQESELRV